MTYFVAVISVVGISLGQILFKIGAKSLQSTGNTFHPRTLVILGVAFTLYGITTLAWIWVLQRMELGRVYPLVALAFVLVPLGSHLFLGERFHPQYFVGVAFIILGIVVAIRA